METLESNFMLFVIRIWVDIRKMHIGKLTKRLTLIVIFQYHIARWWKLEIHTIGRSSAIHTGYKQEILQRERERVKYDPYRFFHLK